MSYWMTALNVASDVGDIATCPLALGVKADLRVSLPLCRLSTTCGPCIRYRVASTAYTKPECSTQNRSQTTRRYLGKAIPSIGLYAAKLAL
jgi:hypothetical protein